MFKQYNLQSGNEYLTAWLQDGLKKGWRVTLKDSDNPTQFWTVTGMGNTLLPKDDIKGSHNSKAWHGNDFHGKLKGLNISY